jgi:DNA polymerase III subunit beta
VQLTSQRDDLAGALAIAARAASGRSTLPVLSYVLLTADAEGVRLSATDMELSLRLPVTATVSEPGAIVVPRLAADVVRSLAPGEVTLTHRDNEASIHLSGGQSSFKLNSLQADDFPQLPSVEGPSLRIPAEPFVTSVDKVSRAASRDDTRPVLTGVLLRLDETGLTMVATDSYRLALRIEAIDADPGDPREALIPARALQEVARLVGVTKADHVELVIAPQLASFRVGGVEVMSRLIDGQFPDFRQLIPAETEYQVRFDRSELQAVLGRIGVLAPRGTPIRLMFAPGEVTVVAMSEQHGEGKETIPVAYDGEPMEIRFNAEFLRDGVDSAEGDEITLGLISPLRPGIIRGASGSFTYLLMPIRQNA